MRGLQIRRSVGGSRLRDVLSQGLAITESSTDGSFLVLPLAESGSTNLGGRNPTDVGRALAALLGSDEVIAAIQADPKGVKLLEGVQLSLRLSQLEAAIDELDGSLESGEAQEQTYQEWCEQHSWAFGNAYTMRDSVRSIALGDQVDLLLSQTANGLRDIIELKRPDKEVIRFDETHRSWYWSPEASKAIGQCHRYLDALHEAAGKVSETTRN